MWEADPGLVGQAGDPLGPQHRREPRNRLGRRVAATTGTPSMTTLPQGPGAMDRHNRHHHHHVVDSQDLGGLVGLERHCA